MITQLTQENITEYASEAQTIQEPTGVDYTQGVRVGKTIPAKWWNWLFKGATRRLGQAKTDAQNMLSELQNVVIDAGITLDGSDSTQLSQAVTVSVDRQIDNYVADKQGFMTLWGMMPLPASLADYTVIIAQQQLNNVYVMWLEDSNGTKCCVAVSTDMIQWNKVQEFTGNGLGRVNLSAGDIVWLNGAYYILVGTPSSSYVTGVSNIVVLKSTDLLTWTTVYSSNKYSGSNLFFNLLGDKLYLMYRSNSSPNSYVLRLNDAGTAFVDTGLTFSTTDALGGTYGHSSEAIPLDSNKYLVGNFVVDISANTMTALTTYDSTNARYAIGIAPRVGTSFSNYMPYGTYDIELPNGNIALLERHREQSNKYRITVIDSSGTVLQSLTSDATYYHCASADYRQKCLFMRNADQLCYSNDGINYTAIPVGGQQVVYADGYYYILKVEYSLSHYYAHIYAATEMSANAADYTLVGTVDTGNEAISDLNYGGITGSLIMSSYGGLAFVSLDNGEHWKASKKVNGTPYIRRVNFVHNGICYSGWYCSESRSNRVLNYTLYLR